MMVSVVLDCLEEEKKRKRNKKKEVKGRSVRKRKVRRERGNTKLTQHRSKLRTLHALDR